jgi:DNA-binding transcriptional MerR regulator
MYRIRTAAQRAGVSPGLLRAWERRYGLLRPSRTLSGYRVYSDEDVEVLRGAKAMVNSGLSIAEVAQMPHEDLRQAARREALPLAASVAPPPVAELPRGDMGALIEEALAAIEMFDRARLDAVLFRVTGLGGLSPVEGCETFLLPLLEAIGARWESGALSVAAEHFGSAIVRGKILHFLEMKRDHPKGAPVAVCACPENEEHEGALLSFAVNAASRGHEIVYLGANTPIAEILATATFRDARVVALSFTRPIGKAELGILTRALNEWRAAGPGRDVVLGGRGALDRREELQSEGLLVGERVSAALPDTRDVVPATGIG